LKNIGHDEMIAYSIAYCYFYHAEIKNRGSQKINIYITNKLLRLIQIMQNMIQNKISNHEICIEVCPSSNLLMGTVKKGFRHPVINLFERMKTNLKQPNICVSVNTDDQGIFSTSLMSEYSLLANIVETDIDNNAEKGMNYSRDSIYKWINKIRENGIRMFDLGY